MSIEEIILKYLEPMQKDLSEIKGLIGRIPHQKIPNPADYRNPAGKKWRHFSKRFYGGLKDPVIRGAIVKLRGDGITFTDIETYIKDHWPHNPEKHPSKSAIHRFYQDVCAGRISGCESTVTIAPSKDI